MPVASACQWGTDGTDQGNWAPVVIGAETDSTGATWLSIMTSRQNDPTNYRELDFSIELVGDFGGAACFYTQAAGVGYYCTTGTLADFSPSQPGCKTFDPSAGVTVPGCTVRRRLFLCDYRTDSLYRCSSSLAPPPTTSWRRPTRPHRYPACARARRGSSRRFRCPLGAARCSRVGRPSGAMSGVPAMSGVSGAMGSLGERSDSRTRYAS